MATDSATGREMAADTATPATATTPLRRVPGWALALVPLTVIVAALVALLTVGGNTLDARTGPAVEDLAVEQTVLRPGRIELTVRGVGPDPVNVQQVFVNDAYVDFTESADAVDRLETQTLVLDYPWQEGSPLLITMLTSSGATFEHEVEVAVATPEADSGFYGLMALLGTYVGIIPVTLGMLFLPLLRRAREQWTRILMAGTVGLLGFLAVDGFLEGTEVAAGSAGVFGGVELLFVGAALAYLSLVALGRWLRDRRERAAKAGSGPFQLAVLVAVGIGLHNFGEGLAIGSAYAIGELALGTFLVVGFALHNTTEGLAIVAPLAHRAPPALWRLALLGLVAGAPAILGAVVGASAYNPEVAVFLIGVGVGAIVQVIVQLVPAMRDQTGRALYPASVAGILTGVAILYATGLLVGG